MIDERYIKNLDEIFSENLQNLLLTKTIAIIGCGAQGGYIAEFIARLGVKKILLWDGDIFIRSNLNRQLGCLENNIGSKKSTFIKNRITAINSSIDVIDFPWFFGTQEQDYQQLLQSDFIFLSFDDSRDVLQARTIIRKVIENGIPALDCPNNLLGGFISINTKKDLSHYDWFTVMLVDQKKKMVLKAVFQLLTNVQ